MSTDPATIVKTANRAASVGIQKLKRIANGANTRPTTEERPTSDFVASGAAVTDQAYGRLPPPWTVGTMLL
jgi:hypothetical protein